MSDILPEAVFPSRKFQKVAVCFRWVGDYNKEGQVILGVLAWYP